MSAEGTLMLAVTKILQERYGAGEIVKHDKAVAGPPSPEALDALSRCDFALFGSADSRGIRRLRHHGPDRLPPRKTSA